MMKALISNLTVIVLLSGCPPWLYSQEHPLNDLDKQVRAFLTEQAGQWDYMSVPEADGKLLYGIIVKHKYTRALEIGTSTGHSAIWIAWALSKTGGKLITVEIDESRYKTALENFKKAGLSKYIDARLGDAHELVPKLDGPFDFVFADADKNWHQNYFDALEPKLLVGGCYTTHNVSHGWGGSIGRGSYVEYLKGRKNFETTFNQSGAGVAISYKRSEK